MRLRVRIPPGGPLSLYHSGDDSMVAATLPPQTVYVTFLAEINASTTESLIATMANLANQGTQHVYLLFSTPGGAVMNGMNLYNVLKGMPFELTIHNVGNVDSIGNSIFLAGKNRYAAPQSTFMFHGVAFNTAQGQAHDEKLLRERLDTVLSDQKRMGAIIEEHTNLTGEQIANLFREAQTKDATYAVSCGIVHEIRDVQIPPGSPVVSLVFQR
jgi:ATP-dependent Clp protease protease subunit